MEVPLELSSLLLTLGKAVSLFQNLHKGNHQKWRSETVLDQATTFYVNTGVGCMHTKQSGNLCYLTTAHTNQTIEPQSLNDYGAREVCGGWVFYEEYSDYDII